MHQSGCGEVGDAAPPHVERDRAEVRDVEERLDVAGDEVVDLALRALAPHPLQAHPAGGEARRVLLEEALALDAVREAREDEQAVLQVREQPGRDRAVVLDEVALRVALVGPEDLRRGS